VVSVLGECFDVPGFDVNCHNWWLVSSLPVAQTRT